MRLLCFSDIHRDEAAARRLAGAALAANPDALVSAGDLGIDGVQSPALYAAFRHVGVPVLAVPGNHDGPVAYPDALAGAGWRGLDGGILELDGWVIAGYGQLHLDPGFSEPDASAQRDDPALTALAALLEPYTASRLVLVSHLPPWGTLSSRDRRFVDRGSAQLRRWIEARQPAAVICGHVHHPEPVVERIGETLIVNPGPRGWLLCLPSPP